METFKELKQYAPDVLEGLGTKCHEDFLMECAVQKAVDFWDQLPEASVRHIQDVAEQEGKLPIGKHRKRLE